MLSIMGTLGRFSRVELRIGELMRERRLSAYALAKASGDRISRSNAYRLEAGSKTVVSLDEVAALCDVFEVEAGELFQRVPEKKWKRG
jgi:DNA-binding Xre family transcriptional regulator